MCINSNCSGSINDCKNELNLDRLCCKCIHCRCLESCEICAGSLWVKNLCAEDAKANSLCAQNASFNNACINNLTLGNNFIPCTSYRATVNYSVDTVYTLGSLLIFDNIVDDPNGNVLLAPHTQYTAPADGYYMLTYKVNSSNIQTADPILGNPVANLEIYVNGLIVRESYFPFIAFFNEQKALFSSLITLRQGDIVTLRYNVIAGNGVALAGTVDIQGAGVEDGNSLFKIIFMSGLNCGGGGECPICPEVVVPCDPCALNNPQ